MDLKEFKNKFKEEFKAVEDMYEEPTDRELTLMFINNIVMGNFQLEGFKKYEEELKKINERELREMGYDD